ncbi:MAG: zinc-ribbon domain-containing protein [Eubacteriaceae bacterium]|nr:zinc-ribbon domain-containing protein [Eubacteriaceae bacterium]
MFCKKCGKQIDDDAVFCEYCGATVTSTPPEVEEKNGKAEVFTNDDSPSKNKGKVLLSKSMIVAIILSLIIGAGISGVLTYNLGAKPVLQKMATVEKKESEAKKKLNAANEYYAETNNIEVQTDKPKEVKLQGTATVGVDIAPGLYTFKSKAETDPAFYHIYTDGEEDFIWSKNGTEIILKAGEKLKDMEYVLTFTPVKE